MKIQKRYLDGFKEKTLRCLVAKQEKRHLYSIRAEDLIRVHRCTICSSRNLTLLTEVYLDGKLNFFTTKVCNKCLHVFRSVSPSLAWFKRCWQIIRTKEPEIFNPEMEAIRRNRYRRYAKIMRRYKMRGKVLDIGAGYGSGTKVLQEMGYEVDAIEPEDNKARYIAQILHISVQQTSFEHMQVRKKYDVIILAHCLEHLDNPREALIRIKKLLRPDGILYLEVPIIWNFVTWSDALYLTHKSNFSEENIIYLLQDCDFEVFETVHMRSAGKGPLDFGLVVHQKTKINQPALPIIKKTIAHVAALYRKGLPFKSTSRLDHPLRYSIAAIQQFYQTVRLDENIIIEPRIENGFITFGTK